ncbi:MAG: D-2-hydroxyacid dehydrogenase [Gemmatimonadota bacterium]|nr:D-2-hydroxyacid dehydrogenase [Gemmatimonadota bacterium]
MTDARVAVLDLRSNAPRWALTPEAESAIRAAAPPGWELRVVGASTVSDGDGGTPPSDEVMSAIADAELYFGFGLSPALFEAAKKLRWVHSAAAGVGGALFPAMKSSDVILTNSAGVHAVPIAEHVVGGVLFLLRGFDIAIEQQRAGVWDREKFVGEGSTVREVSDCRALIIGAGGIGSAIATRLTALGARCIGVRRRPELGAPPGFEAVTGPDAKDRRGWRARLPQTDIVVLAAPSTPSTTTLFDADALDALPRDAIIVNVSRGTLLDEDALADRLSSGKLRGAVLDVFHKEPLDPSSPLWGMPQVLITPHVSAVSHRGFWKREQELFLENWRRYLAAEPMTNVVDKHEGY